MQPRPIVNCRKEGRSALESGLSLGPRSQCGRVSKRQSAIQRIRFALFARESARDRFITQLSAIKGREGRAEKIRSRVIGRVVYANGKVFVGRLDGMLVGLDAASGKELWKAKVADYKAGDDITSPPTIAKNLVVIGYAGGEYATRGAITAFDQESGKQVWRTHTIPDAGEPGNDSWPSADVAARGGAAAWLVGS